MANDISYVILNFPYGNAKVIRPRSLVFFYPFLIFISLICNQQTADKWNKKISLRILKCIEQKFANKEVTYT